METSPGDPEAPLGLRLDRTLYHDVRTISGVNVVLRGSVQGPELLFHAVRVSDPLDPSSVVALAKPAAAKPLEMHAPSELTPLQIESAGGDHTDEVAETPAPAETPADSADHVDTTIEEYLKVVTPDMMMALVSQEALGPQESLLLPKNRGAGAPSLQ